MNKLVMLPITADLLGEKWVERLRRTVGMVSFIIASRHHRESDHSTQISEVKRELLHRTTIYTFRSEDQVKLCTNKVQSKTIMHNQNMRLPVEFRSIAKSAGQIPRSLSSLPLPFGGSRMGEILLQQQQLMRLHVLRRREAIEVYAARDV